MKRSRSDRGQVVVEYVLLLSLAVTLAVIVTSQLIKRDYEEPENSGAIIKKWRSMQEAISKDKQN